MPRMTLTRMMNLRMIAGPQSQGKSFFVLPDASSQATSMRMCLPAWSAQSIFLFGHKAVYLRLPSQDAAAKVHRIKVDRRFAGREGQASVFQIQAWHCGIWPRLGRRDDQRGAHDFRRHDQVWIREARRAHCGCEWGDRGATVPIICLQLAFLEKRHRTKSSQGEKPADAAPDPDGMGKVEPIHRRRWKSQSRYARRFCLRWEM